MTPKEKALELVEFGIMYALTFEQAIICALKCVDEILQNGFNPQLPYNYWEEVKKEIELL